MKPSLGVKSLTGTPPGTRYKSVMSIPRHRTIGAVVRDPRALRELDERLEEIGVAPESVIVLSRRKDERLVEAVVPGARVRRVESGLTRMQWIEFSSAFLGVTSVSVLMGAVHLATGVVVQAVMTLAAIVGLVIYHRLPQLRKQLLRMALPEEFAREWEARFPSGFALVLTTVPEGAFDAAQEAFLQEGLEAPLAVDRRPVL